MKRSNFAKSALFILFIFISFQPVAKSFAEEAKTVVEIQDLFTPSGWMGDGEYGKKKILFDGAYEGNPHSGPSCIKIKYDFGPRGWAGIYWQNQPDNWGDLSGNNYSKKGISKLTFWAKGTTGKEVVEFKSGCIGNNNKMYKDSFCVTTGRKTLSNDWQKYTLNLSNEDLKNVIGAFCWVASGDHNKGDSITFYLDDIRFE